MLTRNWKIWLGILAGIAAVGGGLYALLWSQGLVTAAGVVSVVAALAAGAWALRGLYVWRETPWVRRVNSFVIAAFAFGTVFLLFRAVGAHTYARTTLYLFAAFTGFLLGINLLRLMLQPGWPVFGVARATLEEAIRMKAAVVCIVMILGGLVLMPLVLSSDDRLTYIVQRYIIYALILVSFWLSIMTVVLATYTTSNDIRRKMVYMSLTKPLGRPQYLVGKWLGIVLLNAVLLAVSGVAMVGFTRALADGQAMNETDALQVEREVLTARIAQPPAPTEGTVEDMYLRTLLEKQERDPETYGQPGGPASALPERIRQEVYTEALGNWLTVKPGESTTYRFEGLTRARANAQRAADRVRDELAGYGLTAEQADQFVDWLTQQRDERPDVDLETYMTEQQFNNLQAAINSEQVQFVFNPYSRPEPDDAMVELVMRVNEQPWPLTRRGNLMMHRPLKVAVDTPQEMSIPAWMISDDGVLEIEVTVPPNRQLGSAVVEQSPVQLNRKDAIPEVFYRVGTFDGNVAKSLAVLWVRLAFLAMLGLMLGSLFSFPVATLAGILVYVMAAFSGGLSEAVTSYASVPQSDSTWATVTAAFSGFFQALGQGAFTDALKLLIGLFAKLAMLLVPSFGEFNPGPSLAEGIAIPNSMLYSVVFRIGLLWTGIITLLGLILFHRRELAKVTV